MSIYRILLLIGTVFTGLGIVVSCLSLSDNDFQDPLIGVVFIVAGSIMLLYSFYQVISKKVIKRNGKKFRGKIYGYKKIENAKVNDHPVIRLIVRYLDDDKNEKEVILKTGYADVALFPVGYSISFWINGGEAIIDNESIDNDVLEKEEYLMDEIPYDTPKGAVKCSYCDAEFEAYIGYSNRCPFCGQHMDVNI